MAAFDSLSPGVQRVLERAAALAAAAAREVVPHDLLIALVHDEGHATDLLLLTGVAREDDATLDRECLLQPFDEPAAADWKLTSVVSHAKRITPRGEEATTLHLLAALIESSDALADALREFELDVDRVLAQRSGEEGTPREPLAAGVRIAPHVPAVDDLSGVYRTLDAAANRAREGLRVLEDHARFHLNDAVLSQRLKLLRHELAQLVARWLGDRPLRHRDTPGDVGTSIHTAHESRRQSDRDIVRANARRAQEALRTLEEFGKRLDPFVAAQLGQLRYHVYPLEQALLGIADARDRLADVRLCLLATDALAPQGVGPLVRSALAGGCPMVQLREKQIPDSLLLHRARLIREWTREAGALFIVNDRPDLAVLADADGVHIGQDDLGLADARRIVGGDRLVGVSTHSVEQIEAAVLGGADYLGVGPVFSSITKDFSELAGLDFVRAAAEATALPWFAIGGITQDRIAALRAAGADRIAVSAAISQADDPASATRELLAELHR
ncbi:MAG: thiamine phosphate synthase [Planctomycetaceae bacterium]